MLDKLYKYRCWSNKYHTRILTHNEIFFSSVNSFNDPFDSMIPVKYELGTEKQIFNLCIYHIKRDRPDLSPSEQISIAENYIQKGKFWDIEVNKQNRKYEEHKRLKEYGVFSLCKSNENIVMWSHYSDFHKGFCVGFNITKFQKFKKKIGLKEKILFNLYKVDYQEDYPEFNPFDMSTEEIIMKPLIIKSKYWNYEEEYRFIMLKNTNKTVTLEKGILSDVILGCKMPDQDKKDIKEILHNKKESINLYESRMMENKFKLVFNKIKY